LAIVTLSGVRGIVGEDLDGAAATNFALKFGNYLKSGRVAVANDTRTTSPTLKSSILSGLVGAGCTVFDLGYSSTPSVFKEVSMLKLDGGIMVTASHNPPEWNGLKFVVSGGRGIFEDELERIQSSSSKLSPKVGRIIKRRAVYEDVLRSRAGKDSAKGVKLALDLAGGVGSFFIQKLLGYEGCVTHSINDSPGIFSRIIDPTVDPLTLLSEIVVSDSCDAGFAFDCDADRLVIVDQKGKKLTGDATLLVCLKHFLENARNRNVAISVDTSQSAEDLVREYNGHVVYSKVGEANVVRKLIENSCGAGGEGSSGGYIEPGFVMCRDGVYASTMIAKMIKSEGSLEDIVSTFKIYHQNRARLEIDRTLAPLILEQIATTEPGADLTDGVKIRKSEKSWVLMRGSNTENVIRVSAEASSEQRVAELVKEYSDKIFSISRELGKL
jgi:phosphomannomutase